MYLCGWADKFVIPLTKYRLFTANFMKNHADLQVWRTFAMAHGFLEFTLALLFPRLAWTHHKPGLIRSAALLQRGVTSRRS
jgi:hypothetical protein